MARVLLAGRLFSHYRIIDDLRRGGMGVVSRAIDTRLSREVVLKVLPPELLADRDRRERFIQEAQAASAIEHPNIASSTRSTRSTASASSRWS